MATACAAEGQRATVAVAGALVPEALRRPPTGSPRIGVACDVVVVTSYDRLWRAFLARRAATPARRGVDEGVLDRLCGRSPLVTVLDGHPHTLAFLGTVHGSPTTCLGVSELGQGGRVGDVHRLHGLDAGSVVGAVLDLVD